MSSPNFSGEIKIPDLIFRRIYSFMAIMMRALDRGPTRRQPPVFSY